MSAVPPDDLRNRARTATSDLIARRTADDGGGLERSFPGDPRRSVNRGSARQAPGGGGMFSRFGDAVSGLGQRVSRDYDRSLLRKVSMLGVDPRSAEGQQILDLLLMQIPVESPEVASLVEQYQGKLIGPQSRKSLAPGVTAGPFNNQYGYQAGDEFRELDNLTTEALARTQDRLAALGILDGYVAGDKDPNTIAAFEQLLFMSNAEGTAWTVQLADLERQKEEQGEDWAWGDGAAGGRDRAPFVAPAYLAPDYATLSATVKDQMRQQLGRDPDESEIAQLVGELEGWYKGDYEAQVAAQEAEYNAQVAATDEGAEGMSGGEFRQVDPLARFRESFERKYAGELDFVEQRDETEETQSLVQGAVGNLSQMSRGGA